MKGTEFVKWDFALRDWFSVMEDFHIGRDELLTHSRDQIRELGMVKTPRHLRKYIRTLERITLSREWSVKN